MIHRFRAAVAGLFLMVAPAAAQAPAAIVEDVSGPGVGVEFMDYVPAGKVIQLGAGGKLVLGYLKSCWRETIAGGTVTIGAEASDVKGGTAERAKVACEAARMQLTAELASKSGAGVFRRGTSAKPRPQFTLYGLSPLVEVKKGSTIVIERVDQDGERYEIASANVRGGFYDFAQDNKALQPAGIYSASSGKVQVLFQIDARAAPGRAPMAGRLIRLAPAG